ncbi:MAG: 4-hydroxy-tetrahydrodipicolinate reductase [Limnochordia bacterium]|jgi:4-hydroxy-tetrahydrodipicolinate reductase
MDIRVLVSGAAGKMGRTVLRAVSQGPGMELVGAVDPGAVGEDTGMLAGLGPNGILVQKDLGASLRASGAQVMVDFTTPSAAFDNIVTALDAGVRPVVGTTGLGESEREKLASLCEKRGLGCLIAPNFAIGAIIMMKCAQMAAPFFPQVEIIELHHDQKIDAPSGTAIKTAEMIREARQKDYQRSGECLEKVKGARGGNLGGIQLHSIRLPGLVAHQEVIFGLEGQVLTIRHDSISRESFMPGVIYGIQKVGQLKGLVYGLENLLFED